MTLRDVCPCQGDGVGGTFLLEWLGHPVRSPDMERLVMNRRRNHAWWSVVAIAALVAASCGGSDSSSGDSTTSTPTATESPNPPPASEPSATDLVDGESISSVDDIRLVVQVIAQGSFRDPAEGTQAGGWTGSGFIIDPDGLVVTNNHVVTGAGALEVLMEDGDEIAAQVLGVSECNDLAVLKLIEPGPYPYLQWYDGEIKPGLDVYTAGFPLGSLSTPLPWHRLEGRSGWGDVVGERPSCDRTRLCDPTRQLRRATRDRERTGCRRQLPRTRPRNGHRAVHGDSGRSRRSGRRPAQRR